MRAIAVGAALAAVLLLSSCGAQDGDGIGHVEVGELPEDASEHFAADPAPLDARLVLRDNGCVGVEVDGVEHAPVWPDGTSVEQDGDDLDRYEVELSNGVELAVSSAGGDAFTANGVVDTADVALTSDHTDSKVATFVAYCAADGPPVAFFDAASFEPTGA